MLYKATISFAGTISMTIGEVRELADSPVVTDLLTAGYIKPVKEEKKRKTAKALV